MENIEFRNMQYLLRHKIILLISVLFFSYGGSFAQIGKTINQPEHDNKAYHLGINLGANFSHFSFTHHPDFLQRDTIMDVESINSPGLNLALLVNFRLGQHWDLRLHPADLTFSDKTFLYTENFADTNMVRKNIQSITLSFPINLEFSSDRINNFKVYTIGGVKFDYDLASNAGAKKAEELIKLKHSDFSAEVGVGFHFYFPVFVLTPELKYSVGLVNVHDRDPNLRYSNIIDKVNSRMITFSITVE